MCITPYGAAGNLRTTVTCHSLKDNTSRPTVIVSDCKRDLETYTLYFVAKNSLPLSVVIKLIGFF